MADAVKNKVDAYKAQLIGQGFSFQTIEDGQECIRHSDYDKVLTLVMDDETQRMRFRTTSPSSASSAAQSNFFGEAIAVNRSAAANPNAGGLNGLGDDDLDEEIVFEPTGKGL